MKKTLVETLKNLVRMGDIVELRTGDGVSITLTKKYVEMYDFKTTGYYKPVVIRAKTLNELLGINPKYSNTKFYVMGIYGNTGETLKLNKLV